MENKNLNKTFSLVTHQDEGMNEKAILLNLNIFMSFSWFLFGVFIHIHMLSV